MASRGAYASAERADFALSVPHGEQLGARPREKGGQPPQRVSYGRTEAPEATYSVDFKTHLFEITNVPER